MSTAEKLNQWAHKVVPGGRTLVLLHDSDGSTLVVASWNREEVDDYRERSESIGQALVEAAQDHADAAGEPCKFLIQWQLESGKGVRALVHRAAPATPSDPMSASLTSASFTSPNAVVAQLLGHISSQQKVLNGSIGAVLAAYERALAMQQKVIESQQMQLAAAYEQEPAQSNEADMQLSAMKIGLLERLMEHAPEVTRHLGNALSRGSGESKPNGHAPTSEAAAA